MNDIDEISKLTFTLVNEQKEMFRLLWIIGSGIITTLVAVVGVLFKLYIDVNNKKNENEKETIKVIGSFSNALEDLNVTIKDLNKITNEILKLINYPILPTLSNIDKKEKN
jgi:hypothetical protein